MQNKMISEAGIRLLETLEGVRYKPYKDQLGKFTVGIGHLITKNDKNLKLVLGLPLGSEIDLDQLELTDRQIDDLLCLDTEIIISQMDKIITRPMTQCQLDSILSFIYNMGIGTFQEDKTGQGRSSLLHTINTGENGGDVGKVLFEYSTLNKVPSAGRLKRRFVEASIFNMPEVWDIPLNLPERLVHDALDIITNYKVDYAKEFNPR